MSMSILNVVYGIVPDYNLCESMSDHEMTEYMPLKTYYSGHSDPMYVGSELKSLDESQNVNIVNFVKECGDMVNDEMINNFNEDKKYFLEQLEEMIDDDNREVFNEVKTWLENTVPTICVVWSTS